jgi:hypothetical protein
VKFLLVNIYFLFVTGQILQGQEVDKPMDFRIQHDAAKGILSVFRKSGQQLVLTQNATAGVRPYIHPIVAPDGNGILTEFSPAHHKHQTGLYWGLKQVNGRDYFMNWKQDYWRLISASVVQGEGKEVKWQTVYDLLDETGKSVLTETQHWTLKENEGKYILDLEWNGEAQTDITFGKFYVGGLFLRMPWKPGTAGEVINAAGQSNSLAEGQRAVWNDIGVEIAGRDDRAHIAILDHPDNNDFPIPWRVDNELGVGPSRQILGDWKLDRGQAERIRYRLVVYTGAFNRDAVNDWWKSYICEP